MLAGIVCFGDAGSDREWAVCSEQGRPVRAHVGGLGDRHPLGRRHISPDMPQCNVTSTLSSVI